MFIELHMIQNFAPSCLNRDDTNAPKDCDFGGYRRARISSQCIKRSIRRYATEKSEELGIGDQMGQRTRLLFTQLTERLVTKGKSRKEAEKAVQKVIEAAGLKTDDAGKTNVLLFLGPDEIERLAESVLSSGAESLDLNDILKGGTRAVDVALFGRMVAELRDMDVEAACQVAHAISTNRVEMEMDFYTAVDDLQPREETGAGMMGIVEFNSSCFYRYALLDTGQLAANLGADKDLVQTAIGAFVKAAIYAIPTGKQNSMAAQNLPVYIRLVVREDQPRSLANAFLSPARPTESKDLALVSIEKLEKHCADVKGMYGDGRVKLDIRSSIYNGHSDGNVDKLLAGVEEVVS